MDDDMDMERDDMDMEEEESSPVAEEETEKESSRPNSAKSTSSAAVSRPASSASRPASASSSSSRPSSGATRPPSATSSGSRPGSGKSMALAAWDPLEEEGIVDEDHPEEEHIEDPYDVERILEVKDTQEGCWSAFGSAFTSLWSTKFMEYSVDREWNIKTTIRELALYIMFLCLVVFLCFGPTSQYRFLYKDLVAKHFEDVEKVEQVPDMWLWFTDEGGFVDKLYEGDWYNTGEMNFLCPGVKAEDCVVDDRGRNSCDGPCKRSAEDANMLYENKLLGVPRLRMLRVRNDSCEIHEKFHGAIQVCYNHYSQEAEDREPFGQGWRRFTDADAWRYQTAKEIDGSMYWGKVGNYGGGGAVQKLHPKKAQTLAIIKELREGLWIDRATRLIIIDFTLYNANVNMFCIAKIAFEIPPTGGLMVRTDFRPVKLLRYVNGWDHLVLGIEIVFFCFIFYYIIEEILEIVHTGWEYFNSVWNIMDIIVIVVSLCTNAMQIYANHVIHGLLKPLLAEPTEFGDFTQLGQLADYSTWIFGLNVFFVWIKVFKYISFNKTMNILSNTLSRCAVDLLVFGFMFQIVMLAFVQFAYLVFGAKLEDYSTQISCWYTLVRSLLGDFDFTAMHKATPVGPWFFIFYIFSCFFILLNMFLAIINDTYSEVKCETMAAKSVFEITDYFARGYNNVLGSVALRNKLIDVENAIKLANDDGTVTYDEIRAQLKKVDFSDVEIDVFFGMSDVNGDGTISTDESNDMIDAIDEASSDEEFDEDDLTNGATGGPSKDAIVTNAEFDVVERRVEKMEHAIGSIITKIDAVLTKMEIIAGPAETETQGAGNATWVEGEEVGEGNGAAETLPEPGANPEELLIEVDPQPEQAISPEDLV